MAQPIDTGPSTSYSDPIYDRLDTLADRIKRRWKLMVAVLILVVAAVVGVRTWLNRDPGRLSAQAYAKAMGHGHSTAVQRDTDLDALAKRDDITPYYRARAFCELAQSALLRNDPDLAEKHLAAAEEQRKLVADDALALQVKLSQAAVAEERKRLDDALALYGQAEAAARGPALAAYRLHAELGAARVLHARGKEGDLEQAIEKLAPVLDRKREELGELHAYARQLYHICKRKLAKAVDIPAAALRPPEPPKTPSVPTLDIPGAPPIPQPGIPGAPQIPQPGIPGAPPIPQPGIPGAPQIPQPGLPTIPHPGVPQPGVPQPGVPQPGIPQPGIPQPGIPQPGVTAPR